MSLDESLRLAYDADRMWDALVENSQMRSEIQNLKRRIRHLERKHREQAALLDEAIGALDHNQTLSTEEWMLVLSNRGCA